jgi:uncharacterized sulfatase
MIPDLMPTFLEIAGVKIPEKVDARSLMPIIASQKSGQVDPSRNWVITGRERHVSSARTGGLPYPMRAIQTEDFLYIRNFEPDRWPMGAPYAADKPIEDLDINLIENNTFYCFPDFDASPTKAWLILNRNRPEYRQYYDWAFGKRPAEELYDLKKDPDQLNNMAANPEYAEQKIRLSARLNGVLTSSGDPRVTADPVPFEEMPFTFVSEGMKNRTRN